MQLTDQGAIDIELTIKPERMAWSVVLIFFAIFCLVSLVFILFVYGFFFESAVPMDTRLRVGRGTGGITESDLITRVVSASETLTSRSAVIGTTDFQSQITVAFTPPAAEDAGENPVASITLKGDTSVKVQEASAPRFDWSVTDYNIQLDDFEGEMNVFVSDSAERNFLIEIQNVRGDRVQILSAGHYTVFSNGDSMELMNLDGSATMQLKGSNVGRVVAPGERSQIIFERNDIATFKNRFNIVQNPFFEDIEQSTRLPLSWACSNDNFELDSPDGVFTSERVGGRMVMLFQRGDNANSSAQTRCKQTFANGGYDVTTYNDLELTASFFIDYQSLFNCGQAGSECPVMLYMKYVDKDGNDQEWYQGIYYADNPQFNDPPRCQSCIQVHQRINDKVWYTFETGNLFNIFRDEVRPAFIQEIEIYASGHQYTVYVDELSILVDRDVIVPSPNTTEQNGESQLP